MSESARKTNRSMIPALALAAVTLALGLGYAGDNPMSGSGEPGDPLIDSRAITVLEASDAAFAESRSLHATSEMKSSSDVVDRTELTELRLARPNLFRITSSSSFSYEGPTSQDDPTPIRRRSDSKQVIASDGETKWSIRYGNESPTYCTTARMEDGFTRKVPDDSGGVEEVRN